jgi:carotenoid cleavage dioxygenase-like enzyme
MFTGGSVSFLAFCSAGEVPLDYHVAAMIHDFGITKNYAVFPEASLYFDPMHCLDGNHSVFKYDPVKPTRFLILPLNATQARWAACYDCSPGPALRESDC